MERWRSSDEACHEYLMFLAMVGRFRIVELAQTANKHATNHIVQQFSAVEFSATRMTVTSCVKKGLGLLKKSERSELGFRGIVLMLTGG
ncbi:MAG: hypothetical protein IH899_21475 [Planctomycetes bacterium]|nr:hypothetical protein [Planctomycetota bacterium]